MHFDFAVVGNGLLGAAAIHELSKRSTKVVGLGAPYGAHARYYSSHEDDSRLVRTYHEDPHWEVLTTRNLQEMKRLDEEAGSSVFRPLPVYYRLQEGTGAPPRPSLRPLTRRSGGGAAFFDADAEDQEGGIVHPKEYIRSMNKLAAERGARIHQAVVTGIIQEQGAHRLELLDGDCVTAEVVVDTRGAFSEGALREGRISVAGKVLVFTASPMEPERGTFCFIDSRPGTQVFRNAYGFFQYRTQGDEAISKFGFTESDYWLLRDLDDVAQWFQGGYRDYPHVRESLRYIEAFTKGSHRVVDIKPCVMSVTPDGKPVVTRERNLVVMTGCNGSLAKCSQSFVQDALRQLGI